METVFDITSFGALGDGETDCTDAIQQALNAAGEVKGAVLVPPGRYRVGTLTVPAGVHIKGDHAWAFRRPGTSILEPADENQPCLLDISGGIGCTISGLSLEGNHMGQHMHGILLYHDDYNGGGTEDTPTIEDCKVNNFSGNAVHLEHVWCFSLRHCMLSHCGGSGLFVDGWDGFVLDNWFSGNKGAGFLGGPTVNSITATGNRVEWNTAGGFCLQNGNSMNITGNYFDRSGGPGLRLCAKDDQQLDTICVTGNIFYRSGAGDCSNPPEDMLESAHIRMEGCINCTVSANAFRMGENDGGGGTRGPENVFVIRHLKDCVFSANAVSSGSAKKVFLDNGEHQGDVILQNNVGDPTGSKTNIFPHFD